MISDPNVAAGISELIIDTLRRFDDSVRLVMERCPREEFLVYRRAVGSVLGEMLEIVNPLYKQHPALKPPGFE